MAIINTLNFLPEIFRTDPNSKFLNATLDQLISEPSFDKINGYIGRTFAPTYKEGDSYLPEETESRKNYQLEPGVVVTNEKNEIQFYNNYTDLINKIQYYGGITNAHSRLFENESYSFNGKIDFDKLVNFSQYYWLPNGPMTVDVFSGAVENTKTFAVTRNEKVVGYQFNNTGTAKNPDIILARGGVYEFEIRQSGPREDGTVSPKFWIQTETGLEGTTTDHNNISTRQIVGITNNGISSGSIKFRVPQADAQQTYISMPIVRIVDLATTARFIDIDNQLVSTIVDTIGGIDGITTYNSLHGKYLAFVGNDVNETNWSEQGIYALDGWGEHLYDEGVTVPNSKRNGIWQIQITDVGNGSQLVNLVWDQDIPKGSKITIKSGLQFVDLEFYKDIHGSLLQVPTLTAHLDTLYYNDSEDQQYAGRIRIVENLNFYINVDEDILGKDQYTSPNGVKFTNGLKIKFDTMVIPSSYIDEIYYVEGVGSSIRLVAEKYLTTPELSIGTESIPFDIYSFDTTQFDQILNGPLIADFITINRSSIDGNAWARSNRWFHEEVIISSAEYNSVIPKLDSRSRAVRPIIEFEPDLQLFNSGKVSYHGVDFLDFTITDAFTQVEGPTGDYFDSVGLREGMTIAFANDFDPQVKNKVFTVSVMVIDGVQKVHLTPKESLVQAHDSVVPILGTVVPLIPYSGDPDLIYNTSVRHINSSLVTLDPGTELNGVIGEDLGLLLGETFWFNETYWKQGQTKLEVNTPPYFNLVDVNGYNFSDTTHYINSSFVGSKVFSYKEGSGQKDKVLGIPLSYRNFNNIGDIEFVNNIDTDSFTYLDNKVTTTRKVNAGYMQRIIDRQSYAPVSVWDTCVESSKQYQIFSDTYQGNSYFEIDILPAVVKLVPNLKVLVNNKILPSTSYELVAVGVRLAIHILDTLIEGDQINILIYSTLSSNMAYYEIPKNLEFNALNSQFTSLTLGQFRNHLTTIVNNSTEVIGNVPGSSNLRDLSIKDHGGSILQHSAPTIYSSLFLTDNKLNFVDSATLAQKEYTRFKNRFLESYELVINNNITDPAIGVDFILGHLNAVKNKNSPWYYSDMVPYDENRTIIEYTVLNTDITEYEIDQIFNDSLLSNKAVLVYLNNIQLIKGIAYSFNQTRPSVVFVNPLNFDDNIQIKIFSNTDGCFIPETPTKLGIYPKFKPTVYVDESFQTPTTVILGHDGSLTPIFRDFRDDLLLELELRIYNNIKVEYNTKNFDINDYIPGKFRGTAYSREEFNRIKARHFLGWAGSNRVDFSSNSWYDQKNPWSWSYSKMTDKLEEDFLPGHWKGIYRYFYDTDEPNKHPWEMLGFSEEPGWWVDAYGPAPYTGGNMVLWDDLEKGIIRFGPTAGVNPTYARPGLSQVIPVTESGELKSPDQFIVSAFSILDTNQKFSIGDEGPVESAWRRSSEYPFAIQQTIALMAPGMYFGKLLNTQKYNNNNSIGQFIYSSTNQRLTPGDIEINGDINGTSTVRSAGYLNWIVDYLRSNSLEPVTTIRNYLDNIDVKLGYKVAGFTDKSYLKILAEQSSPTSTNDSIIVPDENYKVFLNKSTPVDRIVYSGVIVEKTVSGYAVSGYDLQTPFFTIVPSEPNSNQHTITVGDSTGIVYDSYQAAKVIVPYGYEFNNKQQVIDFLISYGRFLTSQSFVFEDFDQDLGVVRDWELAAKEFMTWSQQGWLAGNIIVLSPFANKITVMYNNAVVDEVNNLPTGTKIIDSNFNIIKNNLFNVVRKDNVFTLTAHSELTIGLIDLSLVQFEHALVFDNETVFNDIIYKPELGNRQYRLKVIGNKTNNWSGQVNPPGFIYSNPVVENWAPGKDYRKGDLVSYKNAYYTALDVITASNTFVFGQWGQIDKSSIKTGLLPNLAYNAAKFENMYDVDSQIQDQNINKFSNGLIGHRDRNYFDDLNLNETTQTKFYQGYIRDKGTKDAITALSSASFNNLSGELTFNEEWAFRVGEYGALNTNRYVEIQLDDSKYKNDPISVALMNIGETVPDLGVVVETKNTLYRKSPKYDMNIFQNRNGNSDYQNDVMSAGYVNLNDIDSTLFNIQKLQDLNPIVNRLFDGYKIWVAKDTVNSWGIYRADSVATTVITISYSLDSYATLSTKEPHGLVAGDKIAIRNFSNDVDGMYTVERVDSDDTLFVSISAELETILQEVPTLTGTGYIFVLRSVRLMSGLTGLANGYVPTHGWKLGDKVWVDDDSSGWAVYDKTLPWGNETNIVGRNDKDQLVIPPLPDEPYTIETNNKNFGKCIATSPDGKIVVVTSPGAYMNNIDVILKDSNNVYSATSTIITDHTPGVIVGNSLAMNQYTVAVSSSSATNGNVLVYSLTPTGLSVTANLITTLTDGVANSGFGSSITISEDNNWLFISAPKSGKIYCYQRNAFGDFILSTVTDPAPTNIGFGKTIETNYNGSLLAVGAPYSKFGSMADAGSMWVYGRSYTTTDIKYEIRNTIFSPSPAAYEEFGASVCLESDGIGLIIGAPGAKGASYSSGVVYRFILPNSSLEKEQITFIDFTIDQNNTTMVEYSLVNYAFEQTIKKPFRDEEKFGTVIKLDKASDALLIASAGAYALNTTTVDSEDFKLDGGLTQFIDRVRNAGAVYVYDLLTDNEKSEYCYNQALDNLSISEGEQFGASIAIANGIAFIGSPLGETVAEIEANTFDINNGKVVMFQNEFLSSGWVKIRSEQPKVDVELVDGIFLYDRKTESVLSRVDYIDPAKGKILGIAEEEIAYKMSFDPAKYNLGHNSKVSIDNTFHWGKSQVGQLWLNMDEIRYVDYEQDTLTYRINNWGKLFPGSTVEVCEWVESDSLPYLYTGTGVPKYADNSAYVQEIIVDPITGIVRPKYYFWVVNKTDFKNKLPFRKLTARSVSQLIESPEAQGIPFAAALQTNAISLVNAKTFISAADTILHIDYAVLRNDSIIHNEYELVQEDSRNATIPDKIVNKLIDSITGSDLFGQTVPDYKLNISERYGISVRPRQSMFVDRLVAAKNFVQHVNSVLLTMPVVLEFDISKLYLAESAPENFDPLGINLTVQTIEERSYIDIDSLTEGQQVLVLQDSGYNNQWALYVVLADKSFLTVKIQGYRTADYWKKVDWFESSYDPTVKPNYTVSTIKDLEVLILKDQDIVWVNNDGAGRFVVYRTNPDLTTSLVGVQEGTIQLSDSLWAHGSNQIGFGNDNFDTIKFDLNPTIEFRNIITAIKDDIFINVLDGEFNKLFFVLLDYLFTEQHLVDWAFKTSYISILHKLRKLDQFPNYIRDNQSFYEDYINEVKPYRTKIREYLINYEGNDTSDIHPTDFDLPAYFDSDMNMWRSPNGEHARDEVIVRTNPQYADWLANNSFYFDSVQVQRPGYGYSSPPTITVEGGGGTGTVLEADLDTYTGSITRVRVVKPGTGYYSTPTIHVYGDGLDEEGNQTLICYPMLTNAAVRTIQTTVKFDRIEYEAEIKVWLSNTEFKKDEIIAYEGAVFRANDDHLSSVYFDPALYTRISAGELDCAQDRALAFYKPKPGQTPNDSKQLFTGTEYPGVGVDGVNYDSTQNVELDSQIESYYTDMVTGTRPEDVNIEGGKYIDVLSSHAPEELLPGMTFDTIDIRVFTIPSFYLPGDPDPVPIGYRMSKVMGYSINNPWRANFTYQIGDHVTYGGNTFEIQDKNNSSATEYTSGAEFFNFVNPSVDEVDEFHNHYLAIQSDWEFRRICAARTTTLTQPLLIEDTEIFVVDVSVMPVPSPVIGNPGVIYINGEKITYYTVNLETNSLGQIRRGVWGTGAPLSHPVDSLVADASIEQQIPGDAAYATWLNKSVPEGIAVTDQVGLYLSNTEQSNFIKLCPSYLPWLPGNTGAHIDPNAYRTRFDDDGTGIAGTGTIHAFDIDPFDSYDAG